MYAPANEYEATALLQGDVVTDVQYLGAINYGSIQQGVPLVSSEPSKSWMVLASPQSGPAMVLSHSCEIDDETGVKMTSIILAPIRNVEGATPAGKLRDLISTNLIDSSSSQSSYLKYFYLAPNNVLPFHEGGVADFSKCFSVRRNSYAFLRDRKALQLTDAVRSSMALKLALYFHRAET